MASDTQAQQTTQQQERDYAPSWQPNAAGETVGGKVIGIEGRDAGWGLYPIVTLEDEGGSQVAVHAFHTVLRSELAKRRPQVGDELEIKYLGKRESAGSASGYHAYRVKGGQVQAYNWDADLPEEERAAAPPIQSAPIPPPSSGPPPVQTADDDDPLPF